MCCTVDTCFCLKHFVLVPFKINWILTLHCTWFNPSNKIWAVSHKLIVIYLLDTCCSISFELWFQSEVSTYFLCISHVSKRKSAVLWNKCLHIFQLYNGLPVAGNSCKRGCKRRGIFQKLYRYQVLSLHPFSSLVMQEKRINYILC